MVERGKSTWSKEDEEVEFLPRAGTWHCAGFITALTKGSSVQAVSRELNSSISPALPSPGPFWLPFWSPCLALTAKPKNYSCYRMNRGQPEGASPPASWELGLVPVCAAGTQGWLCQIYRSVLALQAAALQSSLGKGTLCSCPFLQLVHQEESQK